MGPRRISCGVVVTDGTKLLLGHATGSPRWDIPKGLVEPGETVRQAAARELAEETGLRVQPAVLEELGVYRYLPSKDLALFMWRPPTLPDPTGLRCLSPFVGPRGTVLPEFDRFGLFGWSEALARLGKNMARVLGTIPSLKELGEIERRSGTESHSPL